MLHQLLGEVKYLIEDAGGPRESFVIIKALETLGLYTFFDGLIHRLYLLLVVGDIVVGKKP